MATILIYALFFAVCIGYGYLNYKKFQSVITAKAGPTDNTQESGIVEKKRIFTFHSDGHTLSSDDFIRVKVKGNCMSPRHIVNGSELLIKKIDTCKPLEDQIKEKDILLIYLADKNTYKIREFKKFTENEELDTFWYDNNEEHPSSRPHRKESILGVVKYQV